MNFYNENNAHAAAWERFVAETVATCAPLAQFCDTWAAHCGAPSIVFKGQLVRLLLDVTDAPAADH